MFLFCYEKVVKRIILGKRSSTDLKLEIEPMLLDPNEEKVIYIDDGN